MGLEFESLVGVLADNAKPYSSHTAGIDYFFTALSPINFGDSRLIT
jgi:hypothetical protein